jgi:hypothetical protein
VVRGNQYIQLSVVYHPINSYALTIPINDLDLALDWAVVAGKVVEALNDVVRIARGAPESKIALVPRWR